MESSSILLIKFLCESIYFAINKDNNSRGKVEASRFIQPNKEPSSIWSKTSRAMGHSKNSHLQGLITE